MAAFLLWVARVLVVLGAVAFLLGLFGIGAGIAGLSLIKDGAILGGVVLLIAWVLSEFGNRNSP